MSAISPRPLSPTFLPSLNALLASLDLPFTLDNPTDLAPSLLLAILESLIDARLPIPQTVRVSRTREAKSRAMLVLLGVLECDVLRGGTDRADANHPQDQSTSTHADDSVLGSAGGVSVDGWMDEIGLGDVDPERLADGGWEETIFVGELLCWLARRKGILPRLKRPYRSVSRTMRTRSLYSSHHSYGDQEGDTADLSSSLLLYPSPARRPRSIQSPPTPPTPFIPTEGPGPYPDYPDPDFSTLSHITDVPRHPLVHSPEHSLSHSNSGTTGTDLSIRAHSVSSRTSLSGSHGDGYEEAGSEGTVHPYEDDHDAEEDEDHPPIFRPLCIHELEDPSYICALAGPSPSSFASSGSQDHAIDPSDAEGGPSDGEDSHYEDREDEQDTDDPYAPPTPTPRRVRLTGWIDEVDTATELSQFAASRSRTSNSLLVPRQKSQSHSTSKSQTYSVSKPQIGSGWSSSDENIKKRNEGGGASGPPNLKTRPEAQAPAPPHTTSTRPSPVSFKSRTVLALSSLNSPSVHPSPPPPLDSDPPFDVSFSALLNTSTPAKPRPQRRPQSQMRTQTETRKETRTGAEGERVTRRQSARSPSYTPSPPSFSSPPGSYRSASSVINVPASHQRPSSEVRTTTHVPSSSRAHAPIRTHITEPELNPDPRTSTTSSSSRKTHTSRSTFMTASLLTERARLLTELAAVKRARAASGSHEVGVGLLA